MRKGLGQPLALLIMKACFVKEVCDNQLSKLRKVATISNLSIVDCDNSEDKTPAKLVLNSLMNLYISLGPNLDIYECEDNLHIKSYLIVIRGKKKKMILLQNI